MPHRFIRIAIVATATLGLAGAAYPLTPAQSTAAAAKARTDAAVRAKSEADAKARADALAARTRADAAAQMQTKAAVEIFVRSQAAGRIKGANASAPPYVIANTAKPDRAAAPHAAPHVGPGKSGAGAHRHSVSPAAPSGRSGGSR